MLSIIVLARFASHKINEAVAITEIKLMNSEMASMPYDFIAL